MNLHTRPLTNYGLSTLQAALLKKGNLQTVADLLLNTPQDIARRCKTSPLEIKRIIHTVLNAIPSHRLNVLEDIAYHGDEKFSTGDAILDTALQGGMRTGMVWEVVGESGAGKTQLGLQLSLFVQAPKEVGGLAGSACYLTTSSKLPTARLLQISQTHELLSPSFCSLEHVHTISIPTSDFLQLVLTTILPSFIQEQETNQEKKPVKLVIIDALAELFHNIDKTTKNTLVERKQNIAKISASLHEIASSHSIAIVVLNEVVDNFDQKHSGPRIPGEMTYKQQTRGFYTDDGKKAALGPAWTNQVNAKIMLSRTGRRKHLQDKESPPKRRQPLELSDNQNNPTRTSVHDQELTLIRRLRVIFSSVSPPASLDFIVSECGISCLQDNTHIPDQTSAFRHTSDQHSKVPCADEQFETTSAELVNHLTDEAAEVEDKYDKLLTGDTYNDFDWDALEQVLTQTV